jgi:hypothetical protein
MRIGRGIRRAIIAASVAALCERGGSSWVFVAVILSWVIFVIALIMLPRRRVEPMPVVDQSTIRGFVPWFGCIAWFIVFVITFAPSADISAIPIGLLLLSPVFGLMVWVIDSALATATRRRRKQRESDHP